MFAATPFNLTTPSTFVDPVSGQCVARFTSAACTRLTVPNLPTQNASTIIVWARTQGTSQQVLSDAQSDWFLGWAGGKQDVWSGWVSGSAPLAVSNTWVMYTLTRDAGNVSTFYRGGVALRTTTTTMGATGFTQPVLGGGRLPGSCSDVDVGALFVYPYALSQVEVQTTADALTAMFNSIMPPPSVCVACPGGTSAQFSSSSSCSICAAGTWSPPLASGAVVGATNCSTCAAGTFSDSGASVCQPASPGAWVNINAPVQQLGCPAGSYSPGGASSCTPCPAGKFSASDNSSGCDRCPVGFYSEANAIACTSCTAGFSSDGGITCSYRGCFMNGATSCAACNPGFVSQNGSMFCEACSPGTFAAVSTCLACRAGFYSASSAATACSACPAGTYAGDAGASTCTACPPGQYSSPGSVRCSSCPSGFFAANASASGCAPCPLGTSRFANDSTWYCTPCPSGTAANATGFSNCSSCIGSGYYDSAAASGSSSCLACSNGTAMSPKWNASCATSCPAPGTFYDGTPACPPCPIGTFSIGNAKTCAVCPPGTTTTSTGAKISVAALAAHSSEGRAPR